MKASPFLKIILLPVALSLLFFAAGCASLSAQPPSTSLSASLSSTASNDSSRVILSSPPVDALPAPAPRLDGQIIAAVEENGQTNILAASADGSAWASVARDYAPARDPALSPDGTRIAFRSHRDGNWEIYVLNLNAGAQAKPARLTNVKAYDGAPAWSPDGTRLAFESYRAGDLDLWVMQADGANPTNLTEKSGSADFAPAWSPDGKWIAFVSFRTGHKQIFVVAPEHPNVPPTNLSQNDWNDEQPTWSPDGKQLAFVSDRDGQGAIYVMDFDLTKRAPATRLTYSGADFSPAWSPDGKYLAFVSPRPDRQPIFVIPREGGIPRELADSPAWVESVRWSPREARWVSTDPPGPSAPLFVEKPVASSAGHPFALIQKKDVFLAPSWGRMASRVTGSYDALRARVLTETGYDFLGTLADMARDINVVCDKTCDTLSWHKTGRAVDTRTGYYDDSGRSVIEIGREDQLGETYWRVYVRATRQDGTMGEPLKDAPWDLSYRARWVIAPGQGGAAKQLPYGYYVDFTALARQYGWERISSSDDDNFDWRTNKLAMEYWHLQKTDNLRWWTAMREVYSEDTLENNFDWEDLTRRQISDELIYWLKGIPAPSRAWKWFTVMP